MTQWAAFLYEHPATVALDPVLAALAVGFAAVGWDGGVYLTRSGEAYLLEKLAAHG